MNKDMDEPTEADIANLALILSSLLKSASIGQIIIVDDLYAQASIGIEEIIGHIQASPKQFEELFPVLKTLDAGESEMISLAVRQAVDLDPNTVDVAAVICRDNYPSNGDQEDVKTMSALKSLLHAIPLDDPIKSYWLSSQEWGSQESVLMSSETGTIILFDRNFSNEGKGDDHGLALIRNLISKSRANTYCALLSHTIKPTQELVQWRVLADSHGIDRDKFLVISKTRLADDSPDFAGFIHLLRLAILCAPLQQLRNSVSVHFTAAIESTRRRFDEWNVFDFDEVVFGSSRKEGLWEGETLLRVMSTFTTASARKSVFSDCEVKKLILMARASSSVKIEPREKITWHNIGRMALEYQIAETYTEEVDLNTHHLPLELGDIFTRGEGPQKYMLLAQPCDLMVRSDGNRSYDNDYTRMVPLCRIKDTGGSNSYELPFWENDQSGHVHFADVHWIRLVLLDLCVVNLNGKAFFDPNAPSSQYLGEPWKKHSEKIFRHLKKEYEDSVLLQDFLSDAGNKVPPSIKAIGKSRSVPCCSNTGRFKATVINGGLSVNIRRSRRVNSYTASEILRLYTRYQGRTAFDQSVVTESLQSRLIHAPS